MLLVAILSILSDQGSLVGMERFAKRHRQTLNELLGTDFGKSPSDSTFRLLLAQLDVPGFEALLRDWMVAQPGSSHKGWFSFWGPRQPETGFQLAAIGCAT